MKKQLLFVAAFLTASSATSQISINGSNLYTINSVIIESNTGDSIPHTMAGTNQSWDFSGVNTNGSKDTTYIISPAGTPAEAQYPNANIVLTDSLSATGNDNYEYLIKNSNELSLVGSVSTNGPGFNVTNPFTRLSFPLNFGSTNSDTYAANNEGTGLEVIGDTTYDSARFEVTGTYSYTVDSWGAVTLPSGTYDALRVVGNSIQNIKIYGKNMGNWTLLSDDNDTTYESEYYSNASFIPYPLVTQTLDKNNVVEPSLSYLVLAQDASIFETNTIDFSIYPNPSTDLLIIKSEEKLRNVVITDINGKVILRDLSSNKNINVANLAKGAYTLTVQNDNGISSKQFIKQ